MSNIRIVFAVIWLAFFGTVMCLLTPIPVNNRFKMNQWVCFTLHNLELSVLNRYIFTKLKLPPNIRYNKRFRSIFQMMHITLRGT